MSCDERLDVSWRKLLGSNAGFAGRAVARGAGVFFVAALLPACGNGDDAGARGGSTTTEAIPAGLVARVNHTFMPLTTVTTKVFEGEEMDPEDGETIALRVEETVQPDRIVVGGIEVTVIEVYEYEDGELVEGTLDYFAQGPDGVVYYIGEDVDDYENGEVVGHSGAWLAGEGGNLPGVFMLAEPKVGDVFEQERAPGIAEDRSTVVAVDVEVSVPAGTFTGCIETEDVDPLSPDAGAERKFYCPGVGLVREQSDDGYLDLINYE